MTYINIPLGATVAVFLNPEQIDHTIAAGEIKYHADYMFHIGKNKVFFFKSRTTKDEVVADAAVLSENGLNFTLEKS